MPADSKKRRSGPIQLSLFPPQAAAPPEPELPTPPAPPELSEGIRKEIIDLRKKELIAKLKKQTEAYRALKKNTDKKNN